MLSKVAGPRLTVLKNPVDRRPCVCAAIQQICAQITARRNGLS
jgi:hypothetical protein